MEAAGVATTDGPISADELKQRAFAPLKFIVEGLIPTGLTILAGAPKARKSWLALDIALSVARGVACLDERKNRCAKGAVLYLALEDSQRRLQDRIEQMLGAGPAWPANLFFETEWPRMDADTVPRLRQWIEGTPEARLIIIDVFQKIRAGNGPQAGYARDYDDLTALQKLARERDIGILLIHHLRKSSGDPFERMTGSAGFQGASDTLIVLDKGRGGTRLLARGRDIEEVESELAFDNLAKRWRLAQPRPATSAHPERDRIKVLLAESPSPLSAKEVEDATGQGADAVRQLLKSMVDNGEIVRVARGRYSPRTETSAWRGAGDHSNHNDHNAHEERLATERYCAEREEFERQAMNAPEPEDTSAAAETMRFLHDAFEQTLSRMSAVRRSGGAAS